jgi:hypothetical protein
MLNRTYRIPYDAAAEIRAADADARRSGLRVSRVYADPADYAEALAADPQWGGPMIVAGASWRWRPGLGPGLHLFELVPVSH